MAKELTLTDGETKSYSALAPSAPLRYATGLGGLPPSMESSNEGYRVKLPNGKQRKVCNFCAVDLDPVGYRKAREGQR